MQTKNQWKAKEKVRFAQTLKEMTEKCRNCRPPTPLKCVGDCDVWKLKNELKKLSEIMTQRNYQNILLNTLKNKRRLQILKLLTKEALSLSQLQKELKKQSYHHSQKTILKEYVKPLMTARLVIHNLNHYRATTFGWKVNQLFSNFHQITDTLRPHSECYEEKAIKALSESPKTYQELKSLIPSESLSRVLKRLQEANFITKNNENSYIFYFKTRRDFRKEKLSPTEKRIYKNISERGTTAKELASKTVISLRRTYKYLRKFRGKKLVFKRKHPKTYILTTKGMQTAKFLEKIHGVLTEFTQAFVEFATKPSKSTRQIMVPDALTTKNLYKSSFK